MSSRERDDRELEGELRAARPEPRPEIAKAIADEVRPRRSAFMRRASRLQLAMVGSIAALALTPVVAMGFGGFGGFGALKSNPIQNVFKSQDRSASIAEYDDDDEDVLVCVAGTSEVSVAPELAAFWVSLGIAEYGPCPDDAD
jgi:hypothetical protein